MPEQLIVVNGTYEPALILDLAQPLGPVRVRVTSCTGELLTEENRQLPAGPTRLPIPPAASVVIKRRS